MTLAHERRSTLHEKPYCFRTTVVAPFVVVHLTIVINGDDINLLYAPIRTGVD